MNSYTHIREGITAGEETTRAVICHVCEKTLQARSLRLHLENAHDIYQQVVVPNDLLKERPDIRYEAEWVGRKMPMPIPTVPWKTQQCIHAAPALQGSTPEGFSPDPVGRTLPTLQVVHNAVQSKISPAHLLASVPDGGRAENTEGHGHHGCLGPPTTILRRRQSVGES